MSVRSQLLRRLKHISSKEELANVFSDVLLNDKLSTRMMKFKVFYIEDHIIKNYKFFTMFNFSSEFFNGDLSI